MAFASASAEVNRRVVNEARRLGIWVNAASGPGSGDFAVPAVWREGLVTLTVSTSGASPALARALRDRAAGAIGGGPGLAFLLARLRPAVVERVADPAVRRRILASWGDAHWRLDVLDRDGPEAVVDAWLSILEMLTQGDTGPPETPPDETPLPEIGDIS